MVKAKHKCGCTLQRKQLDVQLAVCPKHGTTEIDATHDWVHYIWRLMSCLPGEAEGPRPSDKKEK